MWWEMTLLTVKKKGRKQLYSIDDWIPNKCIQTKRDNYKPVCRGLGGFCCLWSKLKCIKWAAVSKTRVTTTKTHLDILTGSSITYTTGQAWPNSQSLRCTLACFNLWPTKIRKSFQVPNVGNTLCIFCTKKIHVYQVYKKTKVHFSCLATMIPFDQRGRLLKSVHRMCYWCQQCKVSAEHWSPSNNWNARINTA